MFGRWQLDPLDRWQGCEETSGGTLREPSLYSRESSSCCCVCALKRNDSNCGSFSRDFSLVLLLLLWQSRRVVSNDALPFCLGSLKILPSSGFRVEGYSLLLSVILEIDLGWDGSVLEFHVRLIWNIEFGLRSWILLMTRVQTRFVRAVYMFTVIYGLVYRFLNRDGCYQGQRLLGAIYLPLQSIKN